MTKESLKSFQDSFYSRLSKGLEGIPQKDFDNLINGVREVEKYWKAVHDEADIAFYQRCNETDIMAMEAAIALQLTLVAAGWCIYLLLSTFASGELSEHDFDHFFIFYNALLLVSIALFLIMRKKLLNEAVMGFYLSSPDLTEPI